MSPSHKSPNSPDGDSELSSTVEELQQGLEQLEQLVPVFTPNLQWFESHVAEEKQRLRKQLLRELALFWLIALLLISLCYMLFTNAPTLYVVLQGLIFIIPLGWLASRRKVNVHDQ
jgi:hypothetical protein